MPDFNPEPTKNFGKTDYSAPFRTLAGYHEHTQTTKPTGIDVRSWGYRSSDLKEPLRESSRVVAHRGISPGQIHRIPQNKPFLLYHLRLATIQFSLFFPSTL
jgi:hypothetical protein